MAADVRTATSRAPVWSRFFGRPFRARRLPYDLQQYFSELKRTYRLVTEDAAEPSPEVVRELLAIPAPEAAWSDLATLERVCAAVLPDDEVRGHLAAWRDRLRHVIGDDDYAAYLADKPADPADPMTTVAAMRAELLALIDRLNYLYTATASKERIRNRLSFWLSVVTVGAILLISHQMRSVMHAGSTDHASHTLSFAALAGLLGGFVSVQQRLQSASDVDPLFKRLSMSAGFWNIVIVAPISGVVFAVVLYAIFAAGVVNGSVFPVIYTGGENRGAAPHMIDLATFLRSAGPATGADLAKLTVWSFIAGFAERFVPDVLSRLASSNVAKANA
jgi:hypothetical protein